MVDNHCHQVNHFHSTNQFGLQEDERGIAVLYYEVSNVKHKPSIDRLERNSGRMGNILYYLSLHMCKGKNKKRISVISKVD